MAEPVRIGVKEARLKNQSGQALLVCAYEEGDKFNEYHLEGAITWQTFTSKLPQMAKDDEIIFYCA